MHDQEVRLPKGWLQRQLALADERLAQMVKSGRVIVIRAQKNLSAT